MEAKIRALEARMALFEKGIATANNGDAGHGAGGENGGGNDRSSDSSDSSDSGSNSELVVLLFQRHRTISFWSSFLLLASNTSLCDYNIAHREYISSPPTFVVSFPFLFRYSFRLSVVSVLCSLVPSRN